MTTKCLIGVFVVSASFAYTETEAHDAAITVRQKLAMLVVELYRIIGGLLVVE